MEVSDVNVRFSFESEPTGAADSGLSRYETERVRTFYCAKFSEGKQGTITNAKWKCISRADGTGSFELAFTEFVRFYLTSGKSIVRLLDETGAVLGEWGVSFWRQCGTREISHAASISAEVGLRAARVQFEIDGSGRNC